MSVFFSSSQLLHQPLVGSHSTEPQDQNQTDARRRGRRGFDINAAGYVFLMEWRGGGPERLQETGARWEEQRARRTEGRLSARGFPDSRRVRVRFPPGAPASRAIVLITNMSRVNIQSAALTEGVDGDLACGPGVLRHSGCTALLRQEWVPCKFHCRLLLKKANFMVE